MNYLYRLEPFNLSKTDSEMITYLKTFLEQSNRSYPTTKDWFVFYQFINSAYNQELSKRPSVSQLTQLLKSHGFKRPGSISVLYAHGLYILAVKDDKDIYGDGFNP